MPPSPPSTFLNWFARFAAGADGTAMTPREWQADLARDESPRSRVNRIPTGYGKTLGVLAAWLYHRAERNDERWPRPLIWALPMRVLVEQTADEVRRCLDRLGLLWSPGADRRGKVGVHILMGGADPGDEWNLHPEENAVFIATQDMALSRAVTRGADRIILASEILALKIRSQWSIQRTELGRWIDAQPRSGDGGGRGD